MQPSSSDSLPVYQSLAVKRAAPRASAPALAVEAIDLTLDSEDEAPPAELHRAHRGSHRACAHSLPPSRGASVDDETLDQPLRRRLDARGGGAPAVSPLESDDDGDAWLLGGAGAAPDSPLSGDVLVTTRPKKRPRGESPSFGGAAAAQRPAALQRAAAAAQKREAKAAERVAKAAARAGAKAAAVQARQAQRCATGKLSRQEVTAFLDSRLAATAAGRALGAALAAQKFNHCVSALPVESSVLWVRHPPQESAWEGPVPWAGRDARAQAQRAGAQEVPYVLLLLDAARLVAEAEAGSDGEGLLRLCRRVRESHTGATLCVLSHGLAAHLRARELREYDRLNPQAGFRSATVEAAMARLVTHLRGVRQRDVRDETQAAEHATLLTEALSKAPYRTEPSFLVLFSAEAKVQRAFDRPANDPDGAPAGDDEGAAVPVPRREKSLEASWVAALASIPACSAGAAAAIARAYPSAGALVRAYRAPGLSAKAGRELLKDLLFGGNGGGDGAGDAAPPKNRHVGPAVSDRIFKIFQPKERADHGSDLAC